MTNGLTPARLEQLKRAAKRLAREQYIPLNVAQNRLALKLGYANFSLLVKRSRANSKTKYPELSEYLVHFHHDWTRYYLQGDRHK